MKSGLGILGLMKLGLGILGLMKLGLGILGLIQARVRARVRARARLTWVTVRTRVTPSFRVRVCSRAILVCVILKRVFVAH